MVPEYPGILNWLLDGYAESRALGGLRPPAEADTLKDALLSDADPVGEFISACCIQDDAGRIRTSEFYGTFSEWAEDSGAHAWRDATVKRVMIQKGYHLGRARGYPQFRGLAWNTEESTSDYLAKAHARSAHLRGDRS